MRPPCPRPLDPPASRPHHPGIAEGIVRDIHELKPAFSRSQASPAASSRMTFRVKAIRRLRDTGRFLKCSCGLCPAIASAHYWGGRDRMRVSSMASFVRLTPRRPFRLPPLAAGASACRAATPWLKAQAFWPGGPDAASSNFTMLSWRAGWPSTNSSRHWRNEPVLAAGRPAVRDTIFRSALATSKTTFCGSYRTSPCPSPIIRLNKTSA